VLHAPESNEEWFTMRRSPTNKALVLTCVTALLAVVIATGATGATPPPGASATCRDGSYSFSTHRSGTCSHHGGVKTWLSGTGGARGEPASSLPPTAVGVTVLLARRTKPPGGCTLGPRPDRRCSPGAYYSRLTKAVICSSSFRTSAIRNVPESVKFAVEREYGLVARHYGSTLEIDHIVSLELGGSNDIANLFPERAGPSDGYRVKDKLENRMHDIVCAGAISLRSAQHRIAADWPALYKTVFGALP
jgi:hypothetical protein